jgi:hypothetical protein
MKITKERLKEIIKEEMIRVNEEELTLQSLEPEVQEVMNKLSVEDQAIILQFIKLSGNEA